MKANSSSESALMKGTRTLAFCAGELLRLKEAIPGCYDLETVRPARKPEVYAYTILSKNVEEVVIRWCKERDVEYSKECARALKELLRSLNGC